MLVPDQQTEPTQPTEPPGNAAELPAVINKEKAALKAAKVEQKLATKIAEQLEKQVADKVKEVIDIGNKEVIDERAEKKKVRTFVCIAYS